MDAIRQVLGIWRNGIPTFFRGRHYVSDSSVGATYAGKEQYRKMKVKDKTETLIMFVRLCDGRMSCVRNRGGYLCYTAIDKIHGLIIELQYKERKAPRNTIATLTINTQGREVFPISKVFFCLKSP